MTQLHISISAEPIFSIGPVVVTNSMMVSWVITILLSIFAIAFSKKIKTTRKPKGVQSFLESFIEALYNLVSSITGDRLAKEILPFIATFFIFILLGNFTGLLPGVGTIGFIDKHHEYVPLLRGVTADINITLALAITSVVLTQYIGFKHLKFSYLTKFINFKNPIQFFIGILELIAELAKILSFAFRLFGNIFAGEVLLSVMGLFFASLPFLGLEIFVSLVQALVFAMLTLVFMNLATISHDQNHS